MTRKSISVFIVLSVGFALWISRYAPDPLVTYDSQAYIEASVSIDTYFNGKNADGHSYLFRPPVIPLYLHFFTDKILAAKWLNVTCFVLSLWLCYFIGLEFKLDRLFLSLFVISVAVSYPWLQNHFFVWSEPLFGTLLFFLLWLIVTKSHWVWIAVFCVLLYFVRKAGLIISAGIIGGYLLQRDFKKAILVGLVVGAVGISWEWVTWAYSSGRTIQTVFADTPSESRQQYTEVITSWFLPRSIPILARVFILGLAIVLVLVTFKSKLVELTNDPSVKMVFVIVAVYVLVFALLWRLDYHESERYLSVAIPLAMLLFTVLQRWIYLNLGHSKFVVLLAVIAWLIYPVGRTLYHLF